MCWSCSPVRTWKVLLNGFAVPGAMDAAKFGSMKTSTFRYCDEACAFSQGFQTPADEVRVMVLALSSYSVLGSYS